MGALAVAGSEEDDNDTIVFLSNRVDRLEKRCEAQAADLAELRRLCQLMRDSVAGLGVVAQGVLRLDFRTG